MSALAEPLSQSRYCVVIPVKPPVRGKSRLVGLSDPARVELAEAFALDTVAAASRARSVRGVLVVTDDFRLARHLEATGVSVIPDGVTGDLNACLVQAVAEAVRRWPGTQPVALCADLPALLPDELDAALIAALDSGAAFVPDARGTGTCLYTAPLAAFTPRFGPDSRALHLQAGAKELAGAWPHLRQDVDDLVDLGRALALGTGPATAAAASQPRPEADI